jgi:hypothetical protein
VKVLVYHRITKKVAKAIFNGEETIAEKSSFLSLLDLLPHGFHKQRTARTANREIIRTFSFSNRLNNSD